MFKGADGLISQPVCEAFLDTLPQVFCRLYQLDGTVRFAYISQGVYRWTGIRPGCFVDEGRDWLESIHPDDRQLLLDALMKAEDGPDGVVVEYRLAGGDCSRVIRQTGQRAAAENGSPVVWNGCLEDITSLRQVRQDLERTQLLQNMGRLAAGIAHEINTPIQFIGDNLHFLAEAWEAICVQLKTLLQRACQADGQQKVNVDSGEMAFIMTEAPDAIRQSLDGIDRISTLISAMRDFSRLDERRIAAADLNRAIKSSLTLLNNELKYAASVQTELDPALPQVYCSVDEISQAIMNLLVNAGHSIREKIDKGIYSRGQICVRTGCDGDAVEISIADNGMGIAPEIQARIFERFFTTKRNTQAHGTGQGLAMVRSIVEQRHRGRVLFETTVGQGTTFTLRLPVGRQSDEAQP